MEVKVHRVCAILAGLFFLFRSSEAISCYQCAGTNSTGALFQCNEWLNSDIDIKPEACDTVFGAQYCIKHTGRFEGGIGAKRFCSSLDLGNYCNYVKQPGDKLQYRTCIFTCKGDGCNSAERRTAGLSIIAVLLLLKLYNFQRLG